MRVGTLHRIDEAHRVLDGEVWTIGTVGSWPVMRKRRMAEPGAEQAYEATRLAFELGRAVRELRGRRG